MVTFKPILCERGVRLVIKDAAARRERKESQRACLL